jgi:hypothetical protein
MVDVPVNSVFTKAPLRNQTIARGERRNTYLTFVTLIFVMLMFTILMLMLR